MSHPCAVACAPASSTPSSISRITDPPASLHVAHRIGETVSGIEEDPESHPAREPPTTASSPGRQRQAARAAAVKHRPERPGPASSGLPHEGMVASGCDNFSRPGRASMFRPARSRSMRPDHRGRSALSRTSRRSRRHRYRARYDRTMNRGPTRGRRAGRSPSPRARRRCGR